MRQVLLVFALFVATAGVAAAQSNDVRKDQIGNKNTAIVTQRNVTGSEVRIVQEGNEHETDIRQISGAENEVRLTQEGGSEDVATIRQVGSGLQAVVQQGARDAEAAVEQNGDDHEAHVSQSSTRSTAAVTQRGGVRNWVKVEQAGDRLNTATVDQSGDDIRSVVKQDGERNDALVNITAGSTRQMQEGDRNEAAIGVAEGRLRPTIEAVQRQTGNRNRANIRSGRNHYGDYVRQTQEGNDNDAETDGLDEGSTSTQQQIGNHNMARFTNSGSVEGLSLTMKQEGNSNDAVITSWSAPGPATSTVSTDQYGDDNDIQLWGNGQAYNEVTIKQGDRRTDDPGDDNAITADIRSEGNTLNLRQYGDFNYIDVTLKPSSGGAGMGLGSTIDVTQTATGSVYRGSSDDFAGYNNVFDLDLNVNTSVQLTQQGTLNTADWHLNSGGASVNQIGSQNTSIINN